MQHKILIVDDDVNICELLRLYLEKDGFETLVANDGKTAVDYALKYSPDLVLLDIMLPLLDGWQVCRQIRKSSEVFLVA
jgi:DNA-binding response OmpR family regulator